ncbi:unnamed protein product [Nezara viridula]|uniref:Uncharacterized protein n=1 Tax=Nezara viridula TaxID=85310 RepID=A0A9P0HL28_NEZVI|nr:unnamed protein product [Nezara viridula]
MLSVYYVSATCNPDVSIKEEMTDNAESTGQNEEGILIKEEMTEENDSIVLMEKADELIEVVAETKILHDEEVLTDCCQADSLKPELPKKRKKSVHHELSQLNAYQRELVARQRELVERVHKSKVDLLNAVRKRHKEVEEQLQSNLLRLKKKKENILLI